MKKMTAKTDKERGKTKLNQRDCHPVGELNALKMQKIKKAMKKAIKKEETKK